jgi:hypothetical protein
MQIRIARILNILLIMSAVIILLLAVGVYLGARKFPEYLLYYSSAFVLVSLVLVVFYKWLESSWDKRVITGMARTGKIALANIKSAKRFLPLRDTGFTSYWIYEFQGTLYDNDHKALEKTFYEKMNRDTGEIPQGTVYVTYDKAKPDQIFIIPNALIGSLPALMPVIKGYEDDKKITVKYLDAYYHKGMVLKTFKERLDDYKRSAK